MFSQNRFGNMCESELKGLDNEISELSCKIQTLQQNCRHMESGIFRKVKSIRWV